MKRILFDKYRMCNYILTSLGLMTRGRASNPAPLMRSRDDPMKKMNIRRVSLHLLWTCLLAFAGCDDPNSVDARDEIDFEVESRMEEANYEHAIAWYKAGNSINIENTDHILSFLQKLVYADGSPYVIRHPIEGDELLVRLPLEQSARREIDALCKKFAETYAGQVDLDWGNRWLKIYYYGKGIQGDVAGKEAKDEVAELDADEVVAEEVVAEEVVAEEVVAEEVSSEEVSSEEVSSEEVSSEELSSEEVSSEELGIEIESEPETPNISWSLELNPPIVGESVELSDSERAISAEESLAN
jgi:hypothetical protein